MAGDVFYTGLQAPWFACGGAMELIDHIFSTLRSLLMADFRGLKRNETGDILNDFEKGVAHIRFELHVKLSLWQQLPLILAAMGEEDSTKAKKFLKMAVDQYDTTKGSSRHCPLSHTYLGDESEIRVAILSFIDGGAKSQVFVKHSNRMQMIRCNEISAESLHRQGTLLAKAKDSHNAATLSFELRQPEVLAEFTLPAWAENMLEVSDDMKVLERFSLLEHKAIRDLQEEQLLQGRSVLSGRNGMFKLFRQVFCRCDPYSMFETFQVVDDVLDDQRTA